MTTRSLFLVLFLDYMDSPEEDAKMFPPSDNSDKFFNL